MECCQSTLLADDAIRTQRNMLADYVTLFLGNNMADAFR